MTAPFSKSFEIRTKTSRFQMGLFCFSNGRTLEQQEHLKSDLAKLWTSNSKISDPHAAQFFLPSSVLQINCAKKISDSGDPNTTI